MISRGWERVYATYRNGANWYAILFVFAIAGCVPDRGSRGRVERPVADSIILRSEKGPVDLQVRLWPKEPRLSDLVELEIEVGAEAQVVVMPPAFGDAVGDFLVRDYSERTPRRGAETSKPNRRHFYYQLEPVFTGVHLIRSIAIEFIDNRENSEQKGESVWIESEPIEVKITSELGGQVPSLSNLEPMVSPVALRDSTAWWWLAGVLLIVTACAVSFLRSRTKVKASYVYQPTPEEIAHTQLASLLAEDLPSQGMFKDFYLRLTGIVRNYIEGMTSLRAPEQTTEEFLREMGEKAVFSKEQSKGLKEFLEAADMVKYAAQRPDASQVDSSIHRAKEFIDMKPLVPDTNATGRGT
ncbi:MAG: hypothetical protein NTY15_12875 [Planctomycetota bacterium]|nr:hypothetical protein [Planctomycetota bacterium]